MKLYQTSKGTYCETAADFYAQQLSECGGRKSDYDHNGAIVEFPFAATPKADFVAWMNQNAAIAQAHTGQAAVAEKTLLDIDGPLPVDQHVAKVAASTPAPREFFGAQHPLTTMAIEGWCEQAQPHQLGTVVRAAALRLQQIAQEQGDRA